MMSLYETIISWAWIILLAIWLIGNFTTKKTVKQTRYPLTSVLIGFAFGFLFSFNISAVNLLVTPRNPATAFLGTVLCVIGVAFAIWARFSLGRNWSGAVATVKEDHQLIENGAYRYVRHPIYTGFFLGMLGTAIFLGTLFSYIGVALGLIAFWLRIPVEEKLMEEQFPGQYQEYKKRVKAFLPLIV